MFFNVGDIIKSVSSGNTAEVLTRIVYSNPKINAIEYEYEVEWQNLKNTQGLCSRGMYKHCDVCNDWVLHTAVQTPVDPLMVTPIKYSKDKWSVDDIKEINKIMDLAYADLGQLKPHGCKNGNHEWSVYNSGWTEYEYCKHCDQKRN